MDRIKNIAIIALSILCIILGLMADKEPIKTTTYITTKGKITGASNVTLSPSGVFTASGQDLTIWSNTNSTTQNTFNYNAIYAGITVNTTFIATRACGALSYANRDILVQISYYPSNGEISASFSKSIISW